MTVSLRRSAMVGDVVLLNDALLESLGANRLTAALPAPRSLNCAEPPTRAGLGQLRGEIFP